MGRGKRSRRGEKQIRGQQIAAELETAGIRHGAFLAFSGCRSLFDDGFGSDVRVVALPSRSMCLCVLMLAQSRRGRRAVRQHERQHHQQGEQASHRDEITSRKDCLQGPTASAQALCLHPVSLNGRVNQSSAAEPPIREMADGEDDAP
jgi:hypothetical protein